MVNTKLKLIGNYDRIYNSVINIAIYNKYNI